MGLWDEYGEPTPERRRIHLWAAVAFLGASALGYFAAAVSDGGPDTWRLLSATAFLVCAALSLYSYFKKR